MKLVPQGSTWGADLRGGWEYFLDLKSEIWDSSIFWGHAEISGIFGGYAGFSCLLLYPGYDPNPAVNGFLS